MDNNVVITRTATHGRVAILKVEGRLDWKAASQLLTRGGEVAAEGRDLVINLEGVTLISSSGLGALLALTEQFQEQSGSVRLVQLSPVVKAVLDLVDLEDVVTIDPDEATALQNLKAA